MYKQFYSKLMLLIAMVLWGAGSSWAQDPDVAYDFTDGTWSVADGKLTNGTVSFEGYGKDNFKMNTGYFFLGKTGSYINFPTYESAVEKIVVTGKSGASASTAMNVYVGDVAVSTATTGSTGINTYEIASDYQAAGTVYTLKVTNNYNAQITKIEVYFAEGGSTVTVAKPTFSPAAGTYTEAQNVTISCDTEGASIYYTTNGDEPTNQSTEYTGAISVAETTTIKAIAYDATGASSSVATATYTIVTPMTIEEVRAQGTGDDVFTSGTVTSVNGRTAYIQDATAAICVYGNNTLTVGDAITVQGTLTDYNGLLEITNLTVTVVSQGNTVTPTVMTIEEINADDADAKAKQGWLVRIENATYASSNANSSTSGTISQGENSIAVYPKLSGVDDDDVISLTGIIGYYNAVQIVNPTGIEKQEVPTVKYYLAGSFATTNEWADDMVELTNNEGVYTTTKAFDAGTKFKIVKKDVDGSVAWYGGDTDDDKPYRIHKDRWEDITLSTSGKNFIINEAGEYTFSVNTDAMSLTVTGFPKPEVRYVLAQSPKWEKDAITMTKLPDGDWAIPMEVADKSEFKIIKVVDNKETWFGGDTQSQGDTYELHSGWHSDITLTAGDAGSNFEINTPGAYTIIVKDTDNAPVLNVAGWEYTEGNVFEKVTSTDDITDGAYLIVYEGGNVAFDGSLETLDAVSNTISVDITNGSIKANDTNKASVFYIEDKYVRSASGMYIGSINYANELQTEAANGASIYLLNSISFDDDGNAVIESNLSNTTLRFNSASNQNRFRYYKSGQQAIQLYKLVQKNIVTISDAEWATYVAETNVKIREDLKAYIVPEYTHTTVNLQAVTAVPAGTPVILNGEPGDYELEVATADECDDVSANKLQASETDLTSDGTHYMLSKKNGVVGFRKVAEGVTVKAGKAYIIIVNAAKDFFAFGDSDATGIESLRAAGFDCDAPVYDLQGRQVNKLQKGIFIQNGKKLVVK